MIPLLTYALSLLGFAALCISLPRHQQEMLRFALPRRRVLGLRIVGYGAIASAFAAAAAVHGFGRGLMIFGGLATLAAVTVVLFLTWRGERMKGGKRR